MPELDKQLPITEDWLRSIGFKWHQVERQPEKHWLLWVGSANDEPWSGTEDLGIEVCTGAHNSRTGGSDEWFCWLRCDSSHRYHRFLHIRHLRFQRELLCLIHGITGREFDPANVWYGSLHSPSRAEAFRLEQDRLDKRIHAGQHYWYESEKDPDRAAPLREHLDAAIESGKAK